MDTEQFFRLVPIRHFEWKTEQETQNVIILRPRYTSRLGKQFLLPFFKDPFFKIKLDKLGSIVWKNCDGEHTVGEIYNILLQEFKDEEDLEKRLLIFLRQLAREKFITLMQKVSEDDSARQE